MILHHVLARAEAAEAERDRWRAVACNVKDGTEAAEARVAALEEAMEQVKAQQPETLAMIEANGFVFRHIGNEPGNWQHLAFTIYTDLCEVDTIARAALDAGKGGTDE